MAGPVRIAITANGRAARAEIKQTSSSILGMNGAFKEASLSATGMGKTLDRVAKLGVGIFAAQRLGHYAGEFVKTAADFQSSMNLLVTAGGEAQSAIKGVSNGILKISGQTGTSSDQLAEGMYTVEKAGYRAADGLNVLKMAAEGAKAENVDMATMTNAVTSVMTSYHAKASDATSVTNELVAASGAAKTTMQLFAGSLASVLPVASANKISFAEVGGAIATLTQHGTSADEATQELSNTIRNLSAPNQVAQKEMQQLGINVNDLSTHLGQRGLTGTLDLVVNAITSKMGAAGTVLLDTFKKSQSASQDLQIMLQKMPPDLAALSKQFLDGSIGAKDYRDAVKGMGADGFAMGSQFLSLTGKAKGFNDLLKSGQPAAQTFTDALKKIMGGATGMNTALQLSGENMAGFRSRVDEINKAAQDNGKDISTWAKTQKTFNVELAQVKNGLEAVGIKAGVATLPALSQVLEVTQQLGHDASVAGHFLGSIPGPLKSIATEGAIAALVFPRLASGATMATAAIKDQITYLQGLKLEMAEQGARTALASAGMMRLGAAAKTAAGIGGMVLLAQGAQQSNEKLSVLETTLGATATGFAVGGPWGAAMAGAGTLAYELAKNIGHSTDAIAANKDLIRTTAPSMADYKADVDSLTATFNELSGAVTKATRAEVADKILKSGNMSELSKYGLTLKQVTDATLGVGNAAKKVGAVSVQMNDQWGKDQLQINALTQALQFHGTVMQPLTREQLAQVASNRMLTNAEKVRLGTLGSLTDAQKKGLKTKIANLEADQANLANAGKMLTTYRDQTQAAHDQWVQQQLANKGFVGAKKALAALPTKVVTHITTTGLAGTIADAARLARQFNLTPKQFTVLLKAEGLEPSKRNIHALVAAMQAAASQSRTLGDEGGSSFGAGYAAGIQKWINASADKAAAMASAAHAAAMRAQDSHSPSRKARKLGSWYGEGYALGLADPRMLARVQKGGKDLAAAAAKGADKETKKHAKSKNNAVVADLLTSLAGGVTSGSIDSALSKVSGLVDRKITGKNQTKRQNKILDQLKPDENKIKAIAKQYEAITSASNAAGDGPSALAKFSSKLKAEMSAVTKLTGTQINNLDDARQALKDYGQQAKDYAKSISDAIVATGDITTLGINQMTGKVSLPVLLSDMKAKAAQAAKFQADIDKLTKAGLNKASLQQLLAAGPDSLSTADAILSGGAAAIKQVNALSAQLTATGNTLGAAASKTFYAAGINAAQGLVDALTGKQDAVGKLGKKMAKALVDEVKKELKIKSPSRVFKQIGAYSIDGLNLGFDTSRVKRIGTTSAQALVKSFGEPTLSAYMSAPGTGAGPALAPQVLHITLKPEAVNQLLLGKAVTQAQDLYLANGGRRRAGG